MAVLQPSPALVRRQTAMAMSARIITSKRSIVRSRFMTKPAPCWPARPRTIHSLPRWPARLAQNQNDGDPFVMYDQMADRWVISDFAFPSFPGTDHSINASPCLRAPILSAAPGFSTRCKMTRRNPRLGDYPKMAMWNNPQPGGAYHLTVNMFDSPYLASTECALLRSIARRCSTGDPRQRHSFYLPLAGLGDSYSLVAANFRTGDPPPAGRDEMLLAVDSPATGGVTLTQVQGRFFHVDFANPAKFHFRRWRQPYSRMPRSQSTHSLTHSRMPLALRIVPQQGTSHHIDTLGDKIMTPVVYQNRGGTESLWADPDRNV